MYSSLARVLQYMPIYHQQSTTNSGSRFVTFFKIICSRPNIQHIILLLLLLYVFSYFLDGDIYKCR
uniref:Uncharacterized protein n=1 Tax=Helianthus annuus TaxID=4232 RepID=A0A251SKG8_HELAN